MPEEVSEKPVLDGQYSVDHLVVAAPSFEHACAYVADTLGVPPVAGGAHPGRGTRNALLGLGRGCYLEAIGPDPEQPEPDQPRAFGIDGLTEPRFVTWALRVDRIGSVIETCPRGLFGRPNAMSRRLDDGSLLEWTLAFPRPTSQDASVMTVPFLIDWGANQSPGVTLAPLAQIRSLEIDGSDQCAAVLAAAASRSIADATGDGVDLRFSARPSGALRAAIETEWGTRILSS